MFPSQNNLIHSRSKTKSMKKISLVAILAMLSNFCIAQRHVGTWYDYGKIHPHLDYYVNSVGQKNGPYREYDENGVVVKEYNFLNGGENGVCIDYEAGEHNKRLLKSKVTYSNGVLNGLAIYYDEQGMPKQQGNYINDKKEGKWWTIVPIQETDMPNLPEGFKFYKVEKNVKSGIVQDGPFKAYYYPSGKLYSEGFTKNGESTNGVTIYFPDGKLKMRNRLDSTGQYFTVKESYYKSGQIAYYQTFYNSQNSNIKNVWTTEDTLWQYNEDGTPTDYMKQQTDNYNNWKKIGLYIKAGKQAQVGGNYLKSDDLNNANKYWDEAESCFLKAIDLKVPAGYTKETPSDGNIFYNVACIESLRKNTKDALHYLELSFQNGYVDFKWMITDTDMDNIRSLPEYQKLIAQYQK